jgi:hypothetical protein
MRDGTKPGLYTKGAELAGLGTVSTNAREFTRNRHLCPLVGHTRQARGHPSSTGTQMSPPAGLTILEAPGAC